MELFFETFRIEHRIAHNLAAHTARLNQTRHDVFGIHRSIDLAEHLPTPPDEDLYRCRITYAQSIERVELLPYSPRPQRRFRIIRTDIAYPRKSTDRREIDALFAQRDGADEILMVSPDGYLRDTSIANIALRIRHRWFTPADPLLPGTLRAKLLNEKHLDLAQLTLGDLKEAEAFAVMNAMRGFTIIDKADFIAI